MFLDELSPLVREFIHKPMAFAGGFVSGMLRLNLNDEPVRQWLDKQVDGPYSTATPVEPTNGGNGSGPQAISIE